MVPSHGQAVPPTVFAIQTLSPGPGCALHYRVTCCLHRLVVPTTVPCSWVSPQLHCIPHVNPQPNYPHGVPHPGSVPWPSCAPMPHHPPKPSCTPQNTCRQASSPITPLPAVSPTVPHQNHVPQHSVPMPLPTSKASPVKSLAQNSHLTRRLGQPCWTCSGRSRRLSLALHRLGQGMTLKPQVPRWA